MKKILYILTPLTILGSVSSLSTASQTPNTVNFINQNHNLQFNPPWVKKLEKKTKQLLGVTFGPKRWRNIQSTIPKNYSEAFKSPSGPKGPFNFAINRDSLSLPKSAYSFEFTSIKIKNAIKYSNVLSHYSRGSANLDLDFNADDIIWATNQILDNKTFNLELSPLWLYQSSSLNLHFRIQQRPSLNRHNWVGDQWKYVGRDSFKVDLEYQYLS